MSGLGLNLLGALGGIALVLAYDRWLRRGSRPR
jgi:hypothetical protein